MICILSLLFSNFFNPLNSSLKCCTKLFQRNYFSKDFVSSFPLYIYTLLLTSQMFSFAKFCYSNAYFASAGWDSVRLYIRFWIQACFCCYFLSLWALLLRLCRFCSDFSSVLYLSMNATLWTVHGLLIAIKDLSYVCSVLLRLLLLSAWNHIAYLNSFREFKEYFNKTHVYFWKLCVGAYGSWVSLAWVMEPSFSRS